MVVMIYALLAQLFKPRFRRCSLSTVFLHLAIYRSSSVRLMSHISTLVAPQTVGNNMYATE